jgi:hypothetical protein
MATAAYGVIAVTPGTRNPDGSIGERGNVSPGWVEGNPNRLWAVGVRFPTVGCWKVTGTAGTDSLSLVVRVSR